jgi:hypothetical protein
MWLTPWEVAVQTCVMSNKIMRHAAWAIVLDKQHIAVMFQWQGLSCVLPQAAHEEGRTQSAGAY